MGQCSLIRMRHRKGYHNVLDQIRTSKFHFRGGGGGKIEDNQYYYFINTILLRSMNKMSI